MTNKSIHEENIAYFLQKHRFGDLLVYLNRRSEIMWMIQLTITVAIILLGLVAIMPTQSNESKALMALAIFMDTSLGLIYWYLLGRFEKKIAAAIRKAEEIIL